MDINQSERKMESFVVLRNHLAMIGIVEQQSHRKSVVIALCSIYLIAVAKLSGEAETFDAYTKIIYRVVFVCSMCLFYLIIVWKTPEFFGLIKTLEHTVDKRKPKHTHSIPKFQLQTRRVHFKYVKSLEISSFSVMFLILGSSLDPKLQTLYTVTSHRIQKWITALHCFYVFVAPALSTVPSFLASFHAYFTTDLGSDAFEFVNPMW